MTVKSLGSLFLIFEMESSSGWWICDNWLQPVYDFSILYGIISQRSTCQVGYNDTQHYDLCHDTEDAMGYIFNNTCAYSCKCIAICCVKCIDMYRSNESSEHHIELLNRNNHSPTLSLIMYVDWLWCDMYSVYDPCDAMAIIRINIYRTQTLSSLYLQLS